MSILKTCIEDARNFSHAVLDFGCGALTNKMLRKFSIGEPGMYSNWVWQYASKLLTK